MKAFTKLYLELEQTTRLLDKERLLVTYFGETSPKDAIWALYFLMGYRLKRVVNTTVLRTWVAEIVNVPLWLLEESYDHVGDLAETLSLLLPEAESEKDVSLNEIVERGIKGLVTAEEPERKNIVIGYLNNLSTREKFIFLKLITGSFRMGVADKLVIRSIAALTKIPENKIAHRLSGQWEPTEEFLTALLNPSDMQEDISKPYPFYLAYPLEAELKTLGRIDDWQIEWKWDGIRAQLIKRNNEVFLWSRGEDLVTSRFPEIEKMGQQLPNGTVLDGEILAWMNAELETPSSFALLQKRIGRKTVGAKILAEAPVTFLAYDILELGQIDLRDQTLSERRKKLVEVFFNAPKSSAFRLSPLVEEKSWEIISELMKESRERKVEGYMLKRKSSVYGTGRRRGDWWKLKTNPFLVDAVLVYAQAGHGRRAGLYTDYTFAVWKEGALVPFAKAYSGLTDEEIRQVDSFIRKHTTDKFGPVRVVAPQLVFELAFEGIQKSPRHKSGIAVRFPRISRWRHDKPAAEADSIETVMALMGEDA